MTKTSYKKLRQDNNETAYYITSQNGFPYSCVGCSHDLRMPARNQIIMCLARQTEG